MDEFIYSLLSYRDYMRFVKPFSSPKEYGFFCLIGGRNAIVKNQESRCIMADKIKCSECEHCKLYHSRYGNRQRCFCEHPDQEYIIQYFSDRDIRSMPGFIGYTGWNDSIVPCKYSPRWCPIKKGGV